jgi:hypothetical protein
MPFGLQAESALLSRLVGRSLDPRSESELYKAESDRVSPPMNVAERSALTQGYLADASPLAIFRT